MIWLHSMLAVMFYEFLRLCLKRLPAVLGAEVVGLSLVNEIRNCGKAANFHTADWILEVTFVVSLFHF
jgi:hypothetical protein